jgi:hypothetical protein
MVVLVGHVAFGLLFALPAWHLWDDRRSLAFVAIAAVASLPACSAGTAFFLPVVFIMMLEAVRIVLPELRHGEPVKSEPGSPRGPVRTRKRYRRAPGRRAHRRRMERAPFGVEPVSPGHRRGRTVSRRSARARVSSREHGAVTPHQRVPDRVRVAIAQLY